MSKLFENYITGNDDSQPIGNKADGTKYWTGQTFTLTEPTLISSIKILAYRVNSPGTLKIAIQATSSDLPSMTDLASGTTNANAFTTSTAGAWYEITLSSQLLLSASTLYAIVGSDTGGPNGAYIRWNLNKGDGAYSGGTLVYSTNNGVTWSSVSTHDAMFEVWGERIKKISGLGFVNSTGLVKKIGCTTNATVKKVSGVL